MKSYFITLCVLMTVSACANDAAELTTSIFNNIAADQGNVVQHEAPFTELNSGTADAEQVPSKVSSSSLWAKTKKTGSILYKAATGITVAALC